ncbi:MAG TPA: MFS transporter [Candidatus Limnocylindrales bacterium]|nr:MFS transporter [Candidatus Limnocylindrales bacterium]
MRYLAVLGNRDFALLWIGATLSLLGDGLTFVALVWLVLDRAGGATDVGALVFWYTGPVVVGGLLAGLVLDRFDRRRALIGDNLVRGAAIASIPVAAALGVLTNGQILFVAGIYGLLYMVSLAGIPSLIPSLVDDRDLETANALETVSFGIGGIAGPAIAGVLIGAVGAANVLAVDAASYLAFVACLAFVRVPPSSGTEGRDVRHGSGLGPAFGFLLRQPTLLAITLMFMSFNLGEGILFVLLPVLARDVLAVGASGYGALAASFTAGSLVGALAVGAVRWRWPIGRSIAAAQLATGLALLGLALRPDLAGAVVVLALAGLLAAPLTIWAQSLRMRLIPDEIRGRTFALLRTLMQSTPPLGGLVGGLLLSAGLLDPAAIAIGLLVAVPGAVGLVLPALGGAAIARPAVDRASPGGSPSSVEPA